MEGVERSILVLSEDGERVLFTSPRCRISINDDMSVTITDLSVGPPSWLRILQAGLVRASQRPATLNELSRGSS